jgi:hypothetical protein
MKSNKGIHQELCFMVRDLEPVVKKAPTCQNSECVNYGASATDRTDQYLRAGGKITAYIAKNIEERALQE